MATTEPVNTSGKRRRGRCKKWKVSHTAAEKLSDTADTQGLSELHVACLYGQLATVQRLVESSCCCINSRGSQGRQPVHMVLSSRSSPNTSRCLRYLLENGADVNITTDTGQTPLHLAASEDLLACTEMLVQAGADVSARDSMGHTPLDLARIWCRRNIARYLKSCMWQADKKQEMEDRKQVQALYTDLVDAVKMRDLNKKTVADEKMAEWANKKGLPLPKDFSPRALVSRYHTRCLSSDQDSTNPKCAKGSCTLPVTSAPRPWTIHTGLQPEDPRREPDLRDSVTVWKQGRSRLPQYTTEWDRTPRSAPDLPLNVLERVLFPRAFPPRASLSQHSTIDILEVQHKGCPQGRSTSPWSEAAMHLAEVLEPGHF